MRALALTVLLLACRDEPGDPGSFPVDTGSPDAPLNDPDVPWVEAPELDTPGDPSDTPSGWQVENVWRGMVGCSVWHERPDGGGSAYDDVWGLVVLVEADDEGRARIPSTCVPSRLDDTFGTISLGPVTCSDWVRLNPADLGSAPEVSVAYERRTPDGGTTLRWNADQREDGLRISLSKLTTFADGASTSRFCDGVFQWVDGPEP